MKNKSAITAPVFVCVILLLLTVSDKLLELILKGGGNDMTFSAGVVQLFIFAIPAAFYLRVRNADLMDCACIRPVPLVTVPFVAAAAFTYFFTAAIILFVQSRFPEIFAGSVNTAITDSSASPFSAVMSYVLLPAIVEEFFFRSILVSDYSRYGGPSAVIISALFFAMIHFSFVQFPLYFILGMILALMTYVTKSSFPAFFVHLANNAAVIYLGGKTGEFLRGTSSSIVLIFLLVVAFMVSFLSMLSAMEDIYERRSILYERGELDGSRRDALSKMTRAGRVEGAEEPIPRRVSGAFISPTLLLAAVLFVLITIDII